MRPSRCLATTALARSGGFTCFGSPEATSHKHLPRLLAAHFFRLCPAEPHVPTIRSTEFRGLARIPETASPPALLPPRSPLCQTTCGPILDACNVYYIRPSDNLPKFDTFLPACPLRPL